MPIHGRFSGEWIAENAAGDLMALVNEIDKAAEVIQKLAYHEVNFLQIYREAGQQLLAIEDMRVILLDAIQRINAVIEAKK